MSSYENTSVIGDKPLKCNLFSWIYFLDKEDASLTEGQRTSLEKLLKEASEACQNFSSQHKDSHGAISRMGKAIDRVRLPVLLKPVYC